MSPTGTSVEESETLLRAEVERLLGASEGIAAAATQLDGLKMLALGSVHLARELCLGVLGEAAASPPRSLNAHRLARHLWELEVELHYAHQNPEVRLEQMVARDAINVLGVYRAQPKKHRRKMNAEKKRIYEEYERVARPKNDDAAGGGAAAGRFPLTSGDLSRTG